MNDIKFCLQFFHQYGQNNLLKYFARVQPVEVQHGYWVSNLIYKQNTVLRWIF